MAIWTAATGELPARPAAMDDPSVTSDRTVATFGRGLSCACATDFADEAARRAVFVDRIDRVLLKGQPPLEAVREAAGAEQKIIDAYYKT